MLQPNAKNRPSPAAVDAFQQRGEKLIEEATAAHVARREASADGDDKFMEQMLKAGTLADRVAAMTLRVQQSPVHGLPMIDQLLK
jgi:ribosome biogenesis protein MAK21